MSGGEGMKTLQETVESVWSQAADLCHDWNRIGQCTLVLAAFAILCATVSAFATVHIFYFDEVNYIDSPPTKLISEEGRWLVYILYHLLDLVGARVALFLNLLLLFLFLFFVTWRYIKRFGYAFAFAVLCISASSLTHQLLWPSMTLLSIVLLIVAGSVVRRFPIHIFYVIFGTLFLGCISTFYYLLPLVHLPLLTKSTLQANFRTLIIQIVPAWAGGFVVGSLVMVGVVYCFTYYTTGEGQIGLTISEWRKAGLQSGFGNSIVRSVESLIDHLDIFTFRSKGIVAIAVAALAVGISSGFRHLPARLLFLGIILAHYVLIIPVDIHIQLRSAVPAAIGFTALLFLTPQVGRLKLVLQSALLLCMSVAWSAQSINSLSYETGIVETYYEELLRVTPMSPKLYQGVALLNDHPSVRAASASVTQRLDLPEKLLGHHYQPQMSVNRADTWVPVAREAGFKEVRLCGEVFYDKEGTLCREIAIRFPRPTKNSGGSGLYEVIGEQDGFLVLSISEDLKAASGWLGGVVNEAEMEERYER